MKRPLSALTAFALLATPALARSELDGAWQVEGAKCDATGDSAPFTIAEGTMSFFESSCEIVQDQPTGIGQSWGLQLSCSGEGETWDALVLAMISDDERLILYWDDGFSFIANRCE